MGDIMFSWRKTDQNLANYLHASVFSQYAFYQGAFLTLSLQRTDLYKGLEQTLCERTEGTSVFWRFMLGL